MDLQNKSSLILTDRLRLLKSYYISHSFAPIFIDVRTCAPRKNLSVMASLVYRVWEFDRPFYEFRQTWAFSITCPRCVLQFGVTESKLYLRPRETRSKLWCGRLGCHTPMHDWDSFPSAHFTATLPHPQVEMLQFLITEGIMPPPCNLCATPVMNLKEMREAALIWRESSLLCSLPQSANTHF